MPNVVPIDSLISHHTQHVPCHTPGKSPIFLTIFLKWTWGLAILTFFGLGNGTPLDAHPIVNLKSPQSFIADPSTEAYYIANANGEPGVRDNNGFISKLGPDGEITQFYFIQGGMDHTVLHSPYGMTISNKTLYVADLDSVRGFDTTSGQPMVTVSLSRYHTTELSGITSTSDGVLYVADTDHNIIFRIDSRADHAVSIFSQDEELAGPRGLAIHPKTGELIVTTLNNGTVLALSSEGSITEIVSNGFFTSRFHNLSGVDFDQYGNMYISDLTGGKVWRIRPDSKMEVIAEFLISPASLSIDRKKHLILVPYLYAQGAEMNGLERPSNIGRKKKKRTFADYGMGLFKKDKADE
ncbi:MAG: hypothetical protein O7F12_07985 [Nitrospirae bacterium]|jgi:DNA-binding beta-propeller fold protein YncE|nr:hypothetical protein [Nitrospirota bacterium]